jgi:hypothetical protein
VADGTSLQDALAGAAGTHAPEPSPDGEARKPEDQLLAQLIDWYEAAEDSSVTAREKSERDRDYVDNKQLTEDEVRKLEARGQPAIVLNVIRSRAAFMSGMEKKQRRDPKAYPRNNPNDVAAAEAFTDGMRYVVDAADYLTQRSAAFKNIAIEGFGGVELAAVPKRNGDIEITISHSPWARLFFDPHSEKPDFSDARYRGMVLWMDLDEALERAVAGGADEKHAREILETTLTRTPWRGATYEDKPRHRVWGDRNRKRVRIVMMWYRKRGVWTYCEFTQAGVLFSNEAPYVDQDGESYCPWVWDSANVDRDNNRYGEVRHLIDPQDEINKRRSKALHQAVSRGVIASSGAVDDVNKTRRELARPDFYIELTPGADRFDVVDGVQLAAGQAALLQEAMAYIMQAGPNAAMLGKGVEDQSGRAIEAQQAGGLIEQSDLMDVLRRFDRRVFTIIAYMIKQFKTAEWWVRVTDDDEAPRWVGLNQPMLTEVESGETRPETEWRQLIDAGEQVGQLVPAQDPESGEPVRHNDVARLDMDILVSDAPESITLEGEAYKALLDLLATIIGKGLPPAVLKLAIEMHPGLPAKRKKQLLDMLEELAKPQEKSPEQQAAEQRAREMEEAKIADTRAAAYSKLTQGEERMARIAGVAAQPPRPEMGPGLTDGPAPGQEPPPGPLGPMPGGEGPPMPEPGPGPIPGPPQEPPPAPPEGGMGSLMMA